MNTKRFGAASLWAILLLPAYVQGEELLDTLTPPIRRSGPNGTAIATSTIGLRQNATYRIVVTGIVTTTTPQPPPDPPNVNMYDDLYFFSHTGGFLGIDLPSTIVPIVRLDVNDPSINNGIQGISIGPQPFNGAHRYEITFVAQNNGVLETFIDADQQGGLGSFQTATSTIQVQLFGERVTQCDGRNSTIDAVPGFPTFGTPGNDVIVGTEDNDQILGRGGNDIICGLGGNDLIVGNAGRDRLFGGPGDDRLLGGSGNDLLDGGLGIDTMKGGPGDDTLFVNGTIFIINGNGGAFNQIGDVLNGGPGKDLADYSQNPGPVKVDLARERQRSFGERLQDIEDVRGTPGNDRLSGDEHSNNLLGEGGDDVLNVIGRAIDHINGIGTDSINGGPGFDKCIIDAPRFLHLGEHDVVKNCERIEQ